MRMGNGENWTRLNVKKSVTEVFVRKLLLQRSDKLLNTTTAINY